MNNQNYFKSKLPYKADDIFYVVELEYTSELTGNQYKQKEPFTSYGIAVQYIHHMRLIWMLPYYEKLNNFFAQKEPGTSISRIVENNYMACYPVPEKDYGKALQNFIINYRSTYNTVSAYFKKYPEIQPLANMIKDHVEDWYTQAVTKQKAA